MISGSIITQLAEEPAKRRLGRSKEAELKHNHDDHGCRGYDCFRT